MYNEKCGGGHKNCGRIGSSWRRKSITVSTQKDTTIKIQRELQEMVTTRPAILPERRETDLWNCKTKVSWDSLLENIKNCNQILMPLGEK